MIRQTTSLATTIAATLLGAVATVSPGQDLHKIAQYEIVNAVSLPGELVPSLNDTPRPHPLPTSTTTGSMGTRANRISFSGSHTACSTTTPRRVTLPAGNMTTVIYYPEITRPGKTGQAAGADLGITAITHPFTRGGGSKTLHLLAVTERTKVAVQVDGRPVTLQRLAATAVELEKTSFQITADGARLVRGSFDERDHGTCVLFDAPGGELHAVLTGASASETPEKRQKTLEEIAQYQLVNAVGLPGELTVSLNDTPRPHPYPAGMTMASMGTRADRISYGGSHTACAAKTSRTVSLPVGTVTTVVFHPEITRAKATGEMTRADLRIATITHPFIRRAGPKTLHLLVATERPLLPVSVNGRTIPVKRLVTTPVELGETAFEITAEGRQLASGNFDERDHFACILFDTHDGGLRAVVFD